MLDIEKQIKKEITSSVEKNYVTFDVGVISSVINQFSSNVTGLFLQKHSNVNINIYEKNTYELLNMLETGTIDCAIIRTPFNPNGLNITPIKEEKLTFITRDKRFENTRNVVLKDISEYPLIVYRRWYRIIDDIMEKENSTLIPKVVMDDARSCIKVLEGNENLGAIVPTSALDSDHKYYICNINDKKLSSEICIVTLKNRIPNALVKDLIECCNCLKK